MLHNIWLTPTFSGGGARGRTAGGMHRMHVHPPPPQPERLVMRKDEAVGNKKKCKFVYLRLDIFLLRIIKNKKQSFNF